MFEKIHLVADWPVMLNDVVIAVVVTVVVVTEVVVDMESLDLVAAVQHGAYNRVAKLLESGQSAQDGELSQTNRR